ncbi:MAG: diphosphomevalonate decarboxylase [Polyangiaceae bacterium]
MSPGADPGAMPGKVAEATAIAHPNIALAKYWGKRDVASNVPAVPSLSVTLAGMRTRTTVAFDAALHEDVLTLGGREASPEARARAATLLARVRDASGERRFARVVSDNDFPTASGLASSASGFAALALAATRAAGLDWNPARVSDLARRSSASAARSLFGGFVALGTEPGSDGVLAAESVPAALPDLRVVVAVTSEGAKATNSTSGMLRTQETSPFYRAWLDVAPRLCADVRAGVVAGDFEATGRAAEASALAMHASAIAAGVVYWNGATLEALRTVFDLRARGTLAFATMDAGPHVKVITRDADVALVATCLRSVPGVLRVLETSPGEGARLDPEGHR